MIAVLAMAVPVAASASGQDACVTAYESSQVLRGKGEYSAAVDELERCARACPSPLREDCKKWRAELGELVVVAVDPHGRELVQATITVDGAPAAPSTYIEAGRHRLRVATEREERTIEVDITGGEKTRVVVELTPTSHHPETPPDDSVWPTVGIVGMALGGASLVGALALTISGHVKQSDLRSTCAPNCLASDVDAIRTEWSIAGGLAAAGGALVVSGLVLFLTQGASPAAQAGWSLTPNGVELTF